METIKTFLSQNKKLLGWVLGILIGLIVFRKFFATQNKLDLLDTSSNNTPEGRQNNAATRAATEIRVALNPSGSGWLGWLDGTDEQAIFKAASQARLSGVTLSQVAKNYAILYSGADLIEDLTSELSSEELNQFNSIWQ